jgi:hypothetical protein
VHFGVDQCRAKRRVNLERNPLGHFETKRVDQFERFFQTNIEHWFNKTDKFAHICSYAPYTATEEFQKNFTVWTPDAEKINKQLKIVYY